MFKPSGEALAGPSGQGLDADTLADAMTALERGETLTPEQADLLTESVVKLREVKADPPASLAELQAQLDAKLVA